MSVVNGKRVEPRSHRRPAARDLDVKAAIQVAVPPYFLWKGIVDRALAALLLLPGLPIIGLLAALVRITSPGPGIFRQVRVGKDGRIFTMYKIRTMRDNAEAKTGPAWTQQADPRVTRLGRVLRKLHLDEFPQLFNVLKGEMSLIGPRPERPEFVHVLAEQIPDYLNRLAVLPGITGLAQINLPPDTDLDSVRRKLVLDLDYIAKAGLLLDLRMLLCTMLRLMGIPGAHVTWLFRLQRVVDLPTDHGQAASASGDGKPVTLDSILGRGNGRHDGKQELKKHPAEGSKNGDGQEHRHGQPKRGWRRWGSPKPR
jgi:lipopolysaccharide/colanic/teichoic acid biosynthesis glycosyltransferase